MTLMRVLCAAAALFLFASQSPKFAAAQSTIDQDATRDDDGLEVIIVNAERRAETLQDVPIAVSAFSGQDLIAGGVFSFNDIETLVPSLEIENAFGGGQPQIRLRGVGFDDYAANNTPAVGVYVDEIAYPFPAMSQAVLFDLAQVEVLRGPQGTLYGRNTTGGAVNFVTNKPSEDLGLGLRAEIGNFGRWQGEAFVTGPLAEGVSARLAVISEHGGAWQFNRDTGEELGDIDRTAVRAMISLERDTLKVLATAHYYNDRSDGVGAYLLNDYTPNGLPTINADVDNRATGWGVSDAFAAATGLSTSDRPFRDNEGFGFNLRLDYDFGAATLTSLTSYERFDRREFNDWDGTIVPAAEVLFNSEPRVFAQELRLTSNTDEAAPLDWIVGVYFADETLSELFQSDFQNSFGLGLRTPYEQEARTLAVFGQAGYAITDRLSATVGLRFEDENRDLVSLETVFTPPLLPDVASPTRDADLSEVSGKVGLDYRLSDSALVYALISRGVKSGGFTALNTLNPLQTEAFNNEVLWAYEIGAKTELLENTLRVNFAAFYYDYTDQQIQGFFFNDANAAIIGRIINVPKSKIYGAELETVWAPFEGFTLSNAIGWKKGEFTEFNDLDIPNAPATIDRSGEALPFPEWSYTGSAVYQLALAEGWNAALNANWTYRDTLDKSRLGNAIFNVDDFWLVNAQLTVGPQDGLWDIGIYARNLTDTDYDETRNFFIQQAGAVPFVANGFRGRPRTY
ncbi:MAG: TonB-dependent receptor, partial [Pseudomonadota bacterium]